MDILTFIIALTLLTALGWALASWVRADSFHPRLPRREWFD